LLTGGSGLLGSELQKLLPDMLAPSRAELDITDHFAVAAYIVSHHPDTIIHAAAITNNRDVEDDPTEAVQVNIIGTANIVLACLRSRTRLVYISTDYVYRGDMGNYSEDDEIAPFNLYAWTKLGGESSVMSVPNHLIIRTSFGAGRFDYPAAFTDKITSKEYVDVIAPQILEAARSPLTGLLNVGSEARSMYEYATSRNPDVKAIQLSGTAHKSPADSSLNLDRWTEYREGRADARSHMRCRVCGNADLRKYLDLGMMPLANNLEDDAVKAKNIDRYPLQVSFCSECALSQTTVIIDPGKLFGHYTYRSSISQGYVRHCREMARSIGGKLHLQASDLVVDIAGNDGALLSEFKDELDVRVVNVDPAENICAIAEERGVSSIVDFWSGDVAQQILDMHGRPKLITATNVFAHVDDVRSFLSAAGNCLHEEGALVLEFPYVIDFIEHREFDTVYFEHLSYVGLKPVMQLAAGENMQVFHVEKHDIHGGSLRVFIGNQGSHDVTDTVDQFFRAERKGGYHDFVRYESWSEDIDDLIRELTFELGQLKEHGSSIAAFGAAAKGNTLLNACRFHTGIIEYIVDDTPEKIGKYSPGTGIPVVDRSRLLDDAPDYLVILAWNFADEIVESLADFRRGGGKFIIPVPGFQIVV
jgi:dTDP-4-dehydrorhamnose reductase/2-polyprenyl-3-methyl-5-hydroxy-6-metoxy-1,4-benzoquinol methylase